MLKILQQILQYYFCLPVHLTSAFCDEYISGTIQNVLQNCRTQQSHEWAYALGKIIIQKDTCTPMFTAALSIIARTREPPTSINR